ncbi:MAG: CDP-glucose 4,6-dehydratase [Proteobacteria bacterium]|nr:CDP-glucose 4,6-dehydratase [Pseudomonadota bacterium]
MYDVFRGKRVLVTGDTGFKGSWLSLWLTELGADVTGYALPAEGGQPLFDLLGLERMIRHVDGDVRDADAVQAAFAEARPEIVFHLAAQSLVRRSYDEPKYTFDTNVGGAVNVLEAVRATPSVRAVVCITSDKCYRNKEWVWGYRENDELGGHDPYSASKAAAEMVIGAYIASYFHGDGAPGVASTRAGNVIGGGDWTTDRIVPDCMRALKEGAGIVLRNPDATRPWQHVLEPLSGYLLLAARLLEDPGRHSGAWNFGPRPGSVRTVRELAETVVRDWGGGDITVKREPGDRHEATLLHLSIDKAQTGLGWSPKWDAGRTIAETVSWYRAVHDGESPVDATRRQIKAFMES